MSDPNWITLTADDILTQDVAAKIEAARTAALAVGQDDPLPEVIADVVGEIRGAVAAGGYTLGEGATIPLVLKATAKDIITHRLLSRLPNLRSKTWADRAADAGKKLERVSQGKGFNIPRPQTADADESSQAARPALAPTNRRRRYSLRHQDGI